MAEIQWCVFARNLIRNRPGSPARAYLSLSLSQPGIELNEVMKKILSSESAGVTRDENWSTLLRNVQSGNPHIPLSVSRNRRNQLHVRAGQPLSGDLLFVHLGSTSSRAEKTVPGSQRGHTSEKNLPCLRLQERIGSVGVQDKESVWWIRPQ